MVRNQWRISTFHPSSEWHELAHVKAFPEKSQIVNWVCYWKLQCSEKYYSQSSSIARICNAFGLPVLLQRWVFCPKLQQEQARNKYFPSGTTDHTLDHYDRALICETKTLNMAKEGDDGKGRQLRSTDLFQNKCRIVVHFVFPSSSIHAPVHLPKIRIQNFHNRHVIRWIVLDCRAGLELVILCGFYTSSLQTIPSSIIPYLP